MMEQVKNKKIGRPTDSEKDLVFKCRIDKVTLQKLIHCSVTMHKNRSEVVRFAISQLYETISLKSGENS